MPPTGGITSDRNADITYQLNNYLLLVICCWLLVDSYWVLDSRYRIFPLDLQNLI